ncbi:MAG: hypothetical protein APF81_06495 [Desulfosporosinus sp. BRH_c37]|nr:MAG: hypothetical protein APF81_06495 [Desulfosporosinus sp. BRH_c37]
MGKIEIIKKLEGDKVKENHLEMDVLNQKNKQIVNEYLESLKLQGVSEQTIIKYKEVIENLLIEQPYDIKYLESDDWEDLLKVRYDILEQSTYNSILTILRGFLTYCVDKGYINGIPLRSYLRSSVTKSIPKYITPSERSLIKLHITDFFSLRDRLFVEFMLSTECLCGEVYGLNINDIHFDKCTATVTYPGWKRRTVTYSRYVSTLIQEYLKNHPTNASALFLGNTGKRITQEFIKGIVHQLARIAGIAEPLYPMRLRYTFGKRSCYYPGKAFEESMSIAERLNLMKILLNKS